MTLRSVFLLCVLLLNSLLTGCISKVNVSATADTAGNVQYAYVTVKGVWLNKNSNAIASDSGWKGKTLDTPITVDLGSLNDGDLQRLVSKINLDAGDYSTLRLLLVDNNESLTSSADDLGLTYNNEVQYLDSSGSLDTEPLELADPSGNLILPVSLNVASSSSAKRLVSGLSSSSSVTSDVTLDFDLIRGLTYFDYDGQAGVLFNATLNASKDDSSGAISGYLDLSDVSSSLRKSAQSVVVTAEVLSSDGSRYVEVKSVAVPSTGSFTISPLPANDDAETLYQLVIHGPGIQTMVIANVPVNPGETTSVQSNELTINTSNGYQVNTSGSISGIPANTQVQFYQTLPIDGLPYLIEFATLNPFTGNFSEDWTLPISKVVYGEYNDASDITFSTLTPSEGLGGFNVGTSAPLRDLSTLGQQTVASTTANSSVTLSTLPSMSFSNDGSAVTVAGTVSFTASAYDSGFVLLTHGGQLVQVVDLSTALSSTGGSGYAAFTFSNVAGGTGQTRYELAARLWNSADPADSVVRVASGAVIDARSGAVSGVTIAAP